jgi:hypothetical protein
MNWLANETTPRPRGFAPGCHFGPEQPADGPRAWTRFLTALMFAFSAGQGVALAEVPREANLPTPAERLPSRGGVIRHPRMGIPFGFGSLARFQGLPRP